MYKRVSLRTPETEAKYQEHLKNVPHDHCPFCSSAITVKQLFNYWFIAANDFPYDDVYSISDLLICNRHIGKERELTMMEYEELKEIKRWVLEDNIYNEIKENSKPRRTVPPHYHRHLLTY